MIIWDIAFSFQVKTYNCQTLTGISHIFTNTAFNLVSLDPDQLVKSTDGKDPLSVSF